MLAAVVTGLAALAFSAPAFAVGTFQASIVGCTTLPGGGVEATIRAMVSGVPAGTPIALRVSAGQVASPPWVAIGVAGVNGTLTHEFTVGDQFPVGLEAATGSPGEKVDPASIIGGAHFDVPFVCPAVKPLDALQAAVSSGALTQAEALPAKLALQTAAALEASGRTPAAILSLRVGRLLVNGLVRLGTLTSAEAGPIIEAINREIVRLGGTP
jgi:hypothetical protein